MEHHLQENKTQGHDRFNDERMMEEFVAALTSGNGDEMFAVAEKFIALGGMELQYRTLIQHAAKHRNLDACFLLSSWQLAEQPPKVDFLKSHCGDTTAENGADPRCMTLLAQCMESCDDGLTFDMSVAGKLLHAAVERAQFLAEYADQQRKPMWRLVAARAKCEIVRYTLDYGFDVAENEIAWRCAKVLLDSLQYDMENSFTDLLTPEDLCEFCTLQARVLDLAGEQRDAVQKYKEAASHKSDEPNHFLWARVATLTPDEAEAARLLPAAIAWLDDEQGAAESNDCEMPDLVCRYAKSVYEDENKPLEERLTAANRAAKLDDSNANFYMYKLLGPDVNSAGKYRKPEFKPRYEYLRLAARLASEQNLPQQDSLCIAFADRMYQQALHTENREKRQLFVDWAIGYAKKTLAANSKHVDAILLLAVCRHFHGSGDGKKSHHQKAKQLMQSVAPCDILERAKQYRVENKQAQYAARVLSTSLFAYPEDAGLLRATARCWEAGIGVPQKLEKAKGLYKRANDAKSYRRVCKAIGLSDDDEERGADKRMTLNNKKKRKREQQTADESGEKAAKTTKRTEDGGISNSSSSAVATKAAAVNKSNIPQNDLAQDTVLLINDTKMSNKSHKDKRAAAKETNTQKQDSVVMLWEHFIDKQDIVVLLWEKFRKENPELSLQITPPSWCK